MLEADLTHIIALQEQAGPELAVLYTDLADHQKDRLAALLFAGRAAREVLDDRYHQISLEVLRVQRNAILELWGDGRISDALLRKLER
jgi:hypothetical protein